MAEDIVDIVTRLSYQTNATALQKDIEQFQKITDNVNSLQRTLNRLRADQQQNTNVLDQRQIRQGIEQTTQALNRENAAMQRLLQTSRPLQEAMQREAGIIGRLQGQLEQLRRARIAATSEQEIGRYNTQINATQARITELMGGNGRQGRSILGQVGQGVLSGIGLGTGIGLVTRGVSEIINFANESARLGREVAGVEIAFNRLNRPDLLDNLRTATKGTVSDLQLMRKAVDFSNFGLPLEKLGELLGFARNRARETGQSVEYITNSLVNGLARQSPRILDNLGLSQVKIREEFKKTGDFSTAVFKILQEEVKRTGGEIVTLADNLDTINARIENNQAELGKSLNVIKAIFANAGLDFVDLLSFNFKSFEESNTALAASAYKTQEKLSADAVEISQRSSTLFANNFKSLADEYATADFDARKRIEKQAESMRIAVEQQIRGLINVNQDDIKSLDALAQAYGRLKNVFSTTKVNFRNTPTSKFSQISTDTLEELQKQVREDLQGLNRSENAADIASDNAYLKAIQAELDLRSGKTEKKQEKSAETLAQKRLKLEEDLQKRIADLRDEYNQTYLKGEENTLQRNLDSIGSKYAKALELLDVQYNEAKRKGLITPAIEQQFQQVRGLTNSVFDNQFDNAYDKASKQAKELRERELQDEIRIDEAKQKLRTTDLELAIQTEQKRTELSKLETEKRYKEEVNLANGNADKIKEITARKESELLSIEQTSVQNRVKIYNDYVDAVVQKIEDAYGVVIRGVDAGTSLEMGALAQKYLGGGISRSGFQRNSQLISANGRLQSNQADQASTEARLAALYKEQDELYAQAQAGKEVEKQLNSNQAKIQELQNQLGQLQEEEANITISIQQTKDEEFQKQLGLLSELVSATSQAYNQINAIQQASLDREISIRQDRVRQAERLADRGNTEALRREEEYLRQAQQQREQSARRQIAINAALTTSEAILGVVSAASQGDPYTLAARVIAAVVAIGAGIASVSAASRNSTSGIASFRDGVIDLQGPGTGTSDSIAARLSKGESVMTADETQRFYGTLSAIRHKRDPLPALAKDLGWNFQQARNQQFASKNELKELSSKMDILTDAVIDNKTSVQANITKDGIYVAHETYKRVEQRRYAG